MYKLRHLFAALLSLLIIYAGAGVAIAHYCCAKCEVRDVCCETCDTGCSTVFYKIDLVKEASASLTVATLWTFSCQVLPDCHFPFPGQERRAFAEPESPPVLPRCYLVLYSVLLI